LGYVTGVWLVSLRTELQQENGWQGPGKIPAAPPHNPAIIMLCLPIEMASKKQIDPSHNLPI
jgi:hypothetical protein